MQETNKIIELREVSVTYPTGAEALKQVDISVEKARRKNWKILRLPV